VTSRIPLRKLVSEYIGGGWGKDAPDSVHTVRARVIRRTDLSSIESHEYGSVPDRFHTTANLKSRLLEPSDIVFEVSGGSKDQPVGRSLLVKSELLAAIGGKVIPASFCKKIRPDKTQVDAGYLWAHFRQAWTDRSIARWQVQSTGISNFQFEAFLDEFEVDLPPLSMQRRIAGILSAYDELIENSQRRIRILESMARAVYGEWFVHFRFPGHEGVPRVASALGEIPRAWEVRRLATVAKVNQSQVNAHNAPDTLQYIDISSVSPGQIDGTTTYAFANAPGRARRIVRHGDVLWSCVRPNRRSHAQVMHPEPNTIASTGFAVLTATDVPFTFLYFATTTDDFVAYLTNNATGAAYPAVTATTFEKAELLIPSALLLDRFGSVTIPMAEQVHTLQRQVLNLRRTRDLLLPRLLAGQIKLANTEN
jgi:type I restriction enzyme S subunit